MRRRRYAGRKGVHYFPCRNKRCGRFVLEKDEGLDELPAIDEVGEAFVEVIRWLARGEENRRERLPRYRLAEIGDILVDLKCYHGEFVPSNSTKDFV